VLGKTVRGSGAIAVRLPRRPPARLATPVLVIAALLAGAGAGSAAFATLWQREASGRQTAEQALGASRNRASALGAQVAVLRRQLGASRRSAAAAGRAVAKENAVVAGLAANARPLVSSAATLESKAGTLTRRAAALSSLLATLDKDLAGLARYVGDASGTLDPAFLKAQLSYLTPNLDSVGSSSAGLAAEVGAYSRAVQDFESRLSEYAQAIHR
jgi:hypothetical protein